MRRFRLSSRWRYGPCSGRKGMVLFLLHEVARELQGCPDVVHREVVLALYVLEAHPAREASNDDGDRRSRAADHGLAVADGGVNYDAIINHAEEVTRLGLGRQAAIP